MLIVVLLLLQHRLWFGDGSLVKVWRLQQALEEQRGEIEQLKARNRALKAEVIDLRQGLEAVEERARTDLGMIKEGETFYQVVEE